MANSLVQCEKQDLADPTTVVMDLLATSDVHTHDELTVQICLSHFSRPTFEGLPEQGQDWVTTQVQSWGWYLPALLLSCLALPLSKCIRHAHSRDLHSFHAIVIAYQISRQGNHILLYIACTQP